MGKRELLNVNSSLMPPGAEMPSFRASCSLPVGRMCLVYWQLGIFFLTSAPSNARKKQLCPAFRCKTKKGKVDEMNNCKQ